MVGERKATASVRAEEDGALRNSSISGTYRGTAAGAVGENLKHLVSQGKGEDGIRVRCSNELKQTKVSGMKSLAILIEVVHWGQTPYGSGFKKSGCGDQGCSSDGRGTSRKVLLRWTGGRGPDLSPREMGATEGL